MVDWLKWCVDDGKGKDVLCVAVYNGIYVGISFENLAMDIALRVATYSTVYWRAIRDQILANV